MFKDANAFSSYSVNDIDAAREFYGGKLGLGTGSTPMGGLDVKLGNGNTVMLYLKPNHEPATFTVLNFEVSDLDTAVDDLVAAGITMERYDMPEMQQDAKGIARDERGPGIAWFKDPAGNVLAVVKNS